MNEPGAVFHCSDKCFVPPYWGESKMKERFVCYPLDNRRARVKLNDLRRAIEKSKNEGGEEKKITIMHRNFSFMWRNEAGEKTALLFLDNLKPQLTAESL